VSDVTIETYLSDRHGSDKYDLVQDVEFFTQKKSGYVEGFISMTIDGSEMLGPDLWDDVGVLWPWLTIMLNDCRENRLGESSLVERAIPMRLEPVRGWPGFLLLTVGRLEGDHYGVKARRASVSAADLYPAVARGYLDAFNNFRRIDVPADVATVSKTKENDLRSWIEAPRDSWLAVFPG
jgi:hypothetical protein